MTSVRRTTRLPRTARPPRRRIASSALYLIACSLLMQAAFATPPQSAAPHDPGVAERRLARIRHGINLSDWFAQQQDAASYTKEHFETTITAADVALIRAMGFDHVRLSVDPRPMFRAERSTRSPPPVSPISTPRSK